MKLFIVIKLLNGGIDSNIANFEHIPHRGQAIALNHKNKITNMICTSVIGDRIHAEEVNIDNNDNWDDNVTHVASI